MALYGLLLFIIYGWVEFEAMAAMVDTIGGLLAFLGIFATAIAGIQLLRSQSAMMMAHFRADLAAGKMNSDAIAGSLSLVAGAILMVLPGYVTDAMGLLCFVPGLRTIIGHFLASHISLRSASRFSQNPFSRKGFTGGGFADDDFASRFQDKTDDSAERGKDAPRQRPTPLSPDIIEGEFEEKK